MAIDLTRLHVKPLQHQIIGIERILENPYFGLFDEMGAGKTLQAIIAAQLLYERGAISDVIVLAPASVLDVWFDPELGELAKHLYMPATVTLFRPRSVVWMTPGPPHEKPPLQWFITNYEFIRSENRLDEVLQHITSRTLLICDESTAVKNYGAQQTKATMQIRKHCGRVLLLNGTPIANSPMDMFSQGNLMHPSILDCKGITKFRARYAEMGGYMVQTAWGRMPTQIIGWKNLDDLQNRFKPYVLQRLKKDCLDLPPVLPPVTLTAELTAETWRLYKQMRDQLVAWLNEQTVSMAQQTITKVLRLSQLTSGFLGGLMPELVEQEERPAWLDGGDLPAPSQEKEQEVSREKLDLVVGWITEQLVAEPHLKLLVWSRFIPELRRFLSEVTQRFHGDVGCIAGQPLLGGRTATERREALRLLDPRTTPDGPVIVGGTYGTGALGLNLTACHTVINLSYDYSYFKEVQTAARVDRPGQQFPVSTFDVMAVGPKGQKTIDHAIIKARREKANLAKFTTSAWVKALTEST